MYLSIIETKVLADKQLSFVSTMFSPPLDRGIRSKEIAASTKKLMTNIFIKTIRLMMVKY